MLTVRLGAEDMEQWLHTDEKHDVLVSLEEVVHQLQRVRDGQAHCWKWAIVALASAINGALTCHLSGFLQIGALVKKKECRKKECGCGDHPDILKCVDSFLEKPNRLLRRARRSDLRMERAGPELILNACQVRDFRKLFEFRDAFLHFEPAGWSIELSGMPRIFLAVLQILKQIDEGGWAFRFLDDPEHERLRLAIEQAENMLAEMSVRA